MCRDNDHGGRRCPNDNSNARRRRRKAAFAREGIKPAKSVSGQHVVAHTGFQTIAEMKAEAQEINRLLHVKPLKNQQKQDKRDDLLEKRVTQLGLALGEEADRRSGFDREQYAKDLADFVSPDYDPDAVQLARERVMAYSEELTEWQRKVMYLQESDENYKEIMAEYRAFVKKGSPYQREFIDLRNKEDDAIVAKIKHVEQVNKRYQEKIRASYISVLGDIRSLGGDVKLAETSNKEAAELLEQTVGKDYPTAWLDASNNKDDSLRIVSNPVRAFYSSLSEQQDLRDNKLNPGEEYTLAMKNVEVKKALELLSKSPGFVESRGRPLNVNNDTYKLIKGHYRRAFDPTQDALGKDGIPAGENWHYGHIIDYNHNTLAPKKVWYKLEYSDRVQQPMISLNGTNGSNILDRETAYHEFVHRSENAVADQAIPRQEEAFLRRRTTDSETLQREAASPIYDNHNNNVLDIEWGRKDEFLNHYMGKEYLALPEREVVSVGSEGIFGARYGMFVGLGVKPDLDYRGFVLGIFATA